MTQAGGVQGRGVPLRPAEATIPSRFEAGFNLTGSLDRTDFGSTGGLPDVAAVLPVHIRLLMSSK